MTKTSGFVAALASLVLLGGVIGAAPLAIAQEGGPTVSKGVAKPLKAAQEAMQKKEWQTALAKLNEADAVSGRSAYDNFLISEMRGYIYVRTNNFAEAARNLEAGLNSGLLPAADVPSRYRALVQINYQLKNYGAAIEWGNKAIKAGYADGDTYTLIAQAYYVQGNYKETLRFVNGLVDDQTKRGQTPKKQYLELILSSCTKLSDAACQRDALERMIRYYPSPELWQNVMYAMVRKPGLDDRVLLNTFRLAFDVGAMGGDEYTEMAQLAIEQGTPGEAVTVLDKAFASNAFDEQRAKDKNTRLLESAKKAAATDQAGLPKLEADAAKAKTGGAEVGLGKAYYSYGQYDKAAAAIQRGITKGGVPDLAEAQLLLGVSYFKSGQKDAAIKAFDSILKDPKYGDLANLWKIRVRSA